MTILWDKVKEVLLSVLPIVFIVLVLHFTVAPLPPALLLAFLVGAVLVVLGLTIFLFGIDQGLEPIGQYAGRSITHTNSYPIVMTASLILGFFISFAEPDLHILAKQVDAVTNGVFNRWILVIAVSIGIGVMMTVGMLRILHNIRVRYVFAGASCGFFPRYYDRPGGAGSSRLDESSGGRHGRFGKAQFSMSLFIACRRRRDFSLGSADSCAADFSLDASFAGVRPCCASILLCVGSLCWHGN